MRKILLPLCLCSLIGLPSAQAQVVKKSAGKLDLTAMKQVSEAAARQHLSGRAGEQGADSLQGFIVLSHTPAITATTIREAGYVANVIDDKTLTARIPASYVETLARRTEVERISGTRRSKLLMNTARQQTNADQVHAGEGLETPFTGKGVIIGIIDGGFQYDHPAFKNEAGNTRILSRWETYRNTPPSTTLPVIGHDGQTDTDHGTHVAGIAAGSRHGDFPYYGMAPEADLVLVSSGLTDNEILDGADYIKQVAEEAGKPWVLNMSFGQYIGSHDGTQPYDQTLSSMAGPGALMAGAVGNENGMKFHSQMTFSAGDTLRTYSFSDEYDNILCDIWGLVADSADHFELTPCILDRKTGKKIYKDDNFWSKVGSIGFEINPYNRKEHYQAFINYKSMCSLVGGGLGTKYAFCLEVRPMDPTQVAGHGFHAWTTDGLGEFATYQIGDAPGDSRYLIGEGAAGVPAAIAVGAYNGAGSFVSAANGSTLSYNGLEVSGAIASYSCHGPSLGAEPKPTIIAPGSTITSAINRYTGSFNKNNPEVICAVDNTGQKRPYAIAQPRTSHFYGVKVGTSMATPAVSGILALWLEANPNLTPEQAKEILQKTAILDTQTGAEAWNAIRGYGKIDAYAGLKEALRLANTDGIGEKLNTTEPVTLNKSAEAWHILFNNNESYADITVLGLDGRPISRKHLLQPRRGDEHTVSFDGLPAGIYLIRIATTSQVMTRRVLVK